MKFHKLKKKKYYYYFKMNTSYWEKIKADSLPALVSAGFGLLGYNMIFGESITDSVPFFGGSAPAWIVVGGGVFASDLVGNILQNDVLTMLPQSPSYAKIEGMLVRPVITGASLYGLFRLGVSDQTDLIRTFGLGAGSAIAGTYTSQILGYWNAENGTSLLSTFYNNFLGSDVSDVSDVGEFMF